MACKKYSTPDFLALDFLAADFNTVAQQVPFAVYFKDYLFSLLPFYFRSEDNYVVNNKGLLERYLSVFGDYIDTKIIPDINCYINIIDASITDSKFLPLIGSSLGNPPDIFQTESGYRNLLSYIVSVYKIKGTEESYKLFFSILGFDSVLTEIQPQTSNSTTTDVLKYDTGSTLIYDNTPAGIYDYGGCEPCSQYGIELTPKAGTSIVVDDSLMIRIKETIKFNEPINAIIRNLIINN